MNTFLSHAKRSILSDRRGLTLIELLIVITILSIIAITILVALKPATRLAESRDARRAQDVNQILTGIFQCIIDNDTSDLSVCVGAHTAGETYEIVDGAITSGCDNVCTDVTSDTHCMRLDSTLSDYFESIPQDPSNSVSGHTGYAATVYTNGMVVIQSCAAETGPIRISR